MTMQATSFSVIIPTRNRHASLDACLQGIATLDYPRAKLQVIVVNDGGADIPPAQVRGWQKELDLCLLNQANLGPGAARNAGASLARSDWLVFTDDDCVPQGDWLSEMTRATQLHPNAVLGGETVNGLRDNVYAEASQCLVAFLNEYYHVRAKKHSQAAFLTSNNLAMARRAFEAVGGFDETFWFAEDRDLCARLGRAGFPLRRVPEARVVHTRKMGWIDFVRQHMSYGRGAYYYHRNQARAGNADMELEPFGFYAGMLLYARQYAPHAAGRIMFLMIVSQLANALGFGRQVLRERKAVGPVAMVDSL
jgi:GT2 family glycosyltransferase